MATLLSQETYCSWCGAEGAPQQCHCRRVNYCNEACMLAGRADHRLSCPSTKRSSRHEMRKVGAVVRISGLKSNLGKKMNGKLAQVIEMENSSSEERLAVALTVEENKVRTALIKPENLTLELSVVDAVQKSVQLEQEQVQLRRQQQQGERADQDNEDHEQQEREVARQLLATTLSSREIVRRIRNNDRPLLQVLSGMTLLQRPFPFAHVVQLHRHGLVDACLEQFSFPEANDIMKCDDLDGRAAVKRLALLQQTLTEAFVGYDMDKSDELRVGTIRRLGPAIMTFCSKKRRLYGLTEQWWDAQRVFLGILDRCLEAKASPPVVANSFEPCVRTALIEFLIHSLTGNPKLYLSVESRWAGVNDAEADEYDRRENVFLEQKLSALRCLSNLMQREHVDDAFVAQIANTIVPAGAAEGISGKNFAECYLDIAATVGSHRLSEDKVQYSRRRESIYFICSMMAQCRNLKFLSMVNTSELTVFLQIPTEEEFHSWAKARIATS